MLFGTSGKAANQGLAGVYGPVTIGTIGANGANAVTGYNYTNSVDVSTDGRTTFLFEIGVAAASTDVSAFRFNVIWAKMS